MVAIVEGGRFSVSSERYREVMELVFKSPELHGYWRELEELLELDMYHDFSPMERVHFLSLGTVYLDTLETIGMMSKEERIESLSAKAGPYQKLVQLHDKMMAMEQNAKKRAEAGSSDPWMSRVNTAEIETDSEKISIKREKKKPPVTLEDLE